MNKKRKEERIAPLGYWGPMSVFDEMDRMFEEMRKGLRPGWYPFPGRGERRVPVTDVKDLGDRYVIESELPGMTKDEVQIELYRDSIEIRAKKEEEKEEKGEGYVRSERGYLSFYRRLPLPEDTDAEKIEARMEDGVLKVTIPKTLKIEEKKKVEIK